MIVKSKVSIQPHATANIEILNNDHAHSLSLDPMEKRWGLDVTNLTIILLCTFWHQCRCIYTLETTAPVLLSQIMFLQQIIVHHSKDSQPEWSNP